MACGKLLILEDMAPFRGQLSNFHELGTIRPNWLTGPDFSTRTWRVSNPSLRAGDLQDRG
jgi:hypothetical protein